MSKETAPNGVIRSGRVSRLILVLAGIVMAILAVLLVLPHMFRSLVYEDSGKKRQLQGGYNVYLESIVLNRKGLTVLGFVNVTPKEDVASVKPEVTRSDNAIHVDLIVTSSRTYGSLENYPFKVIIDDIGDREVVLEFPMWNRAPFKVTEYLRTACRSAGLGDYEVSEGNRLLVISPEWPTIERRLIRMGARINPALSDTCPEDSDWSWLCEITVVAPRVLWLFPQGAVWRASCNGGHMIALE